MSKANNMSSEELKIQLHNLIANLTDEQALGVLNFINEMVKSEFNLEELLSQVTDENKHNEVDWGRPVGKERW